VTPADPDAVAGAVFAALADPTRRQVVRALSEHGGASASALAHDMPVTRQAVAKHLTALRDAGALCRGDALDGRDRSALGRAAGAPRAPARRQQRRRR
jgi:DNA-binding transcriptional ArsR family regulator